ncbi:hypothetical protein A3K55_01800 [Candidatus Shapirobacteria bacterium RBG_13_44_7]|uniref:ABC transporter domain-containing protein n=1 Tax=Candidatus Shapirobacteria bacterium RBG_13_44_7 TaxID=1802149 RepID=A0A1F7SG21_9BACT|nr:MAG: hypothetical protein A3K55_01800 [Candidatus Shapirobacteria bacterium RBG_13_44_7]
MLKLKGVSKRFGEIKALEGVDFEVSNKSVVGLLGPNGAGKTTLMRIIVGFLKANKGEIWWEGKKADPKDKKYKVNIGYLPENNPLYLQMTAAEYLEMTARLKGVEEVIGEVKRVAKECALGEYLHKEIETLSKGYRQRVGLAAALLGEPKLIILDEPTAGLDPNQIVEIRQLIKKLAKNKAVVLSTHILPEAKEVCDDLWIIDRGKIVMHEKTKKIKNLEKKFVNLTR